MLKSFDLAVKPNENFVRVYENVLSKDFCVHLIDKFEKFKEEYVDDRGRVTYDIFLQEHRNQFREELSTIIKAQQKAYDKYVEEFPILTHSPYHKAKFWKLRRIEIGEHYSSREWHYEAQRNFVGDQGCILSSTFYLNDVEEGGETELPYQGMKVKPEVGKVVFFPAGYTHTHGGAPPISNLKYIIASFFFFELEEYKKGL
jgi:hypothetical protein|tara:strand:+ start:127 stop:729 length:603 start_codon:yes stop_codon:yes gene_type:complete